MRIFRFRLIVVSAALVAAAACGGRGTEREQPSASAGASVRTEEAAALDKNAYPVFPNTDAGADPSVPAEQGG